MSRYQNLPAGALPASDVPLRYGIVLFPGFQALDAFGPLDALNTLALNYPLDLCVLAESIEPVSTKPPSGVIDLPLGSNFAQSIQPTHTFSNAPPIDVLIVPGGFGVRSEENMKPVVGYIQDVYPSLKYLITVCTGSGLAARAGVLDGRKATTNKRAWEWATHLRPQVEWIARARWVEDGNIWTAAGVSAGLDLVIAFMEKVYGVGVGKMIADTLEYDAHTDAHWDPFAELNGLGAS